MFQNVRAQAARRILTVALLTGVLAWGAQVSAQDPNYILTVGSGATGQGGSVTLPITLDSSNGTDVQGWSFGICYDTALLDATNLSIGSTAETVNLGSPPDFEQLNLEPGGWTMGVVICLLACTVLPPGADYELAVSEYQATGPEGSSVQLCPCSNLGTPPINAVVVVAGQSIPPVQNCGTVDIVPLMPFIRSDANDDGFTDLSDGVWILNYLFQGGPLNPCLGAIDANGDGDIDTADAIYVIFYFFAGGDPPPAPFPSCGFEANQSIESCEQYNSCP